MARTSCRHSIFDTCTTTITRPISRRSSDDHRGARRCPRSVVRLSSLLRSDQGSDTTWTATPRIVDSTTTGGDMARAQATADLTTADAFGRYLNDHRPQLEAIARRVVNDGHLAEDVVSDAALRVWRRMSVA